jgi:hypothetical protein
MNTVGRGSDGCPPASNPSGFRNGGSAAADRVILLRSPRRFAVAMVKRPRSVCNSKGRRLTVLQVRRGLLAVLLLTLLAAPVPANESGSFEDCGTLVWGIECILFDSDNFGLYFLENMDGFGVGDYVHVTGTLFPCITFCMEEDACVLDNTISLCEPTAAGESQKTASALRLFPNHPNPFSRTTLIEYALAHSGPARLSIYDVRGSFVRTVYEGVQSAGFHTIQWTGRNQAGEPVAAGIYFYRLETELGGITGKAVKIQ